MNAHERRQLNTIRKHIEDCYNSDITANTRAATVAMPRKLFWFLARKYIPNVPLIELAKYAGRTHHATVINAVKVVRGYIETDRSYRDLVFEVATSLQNDGLPMPSSLVLLRMKTKPKDEDESRRTPKRVPVNEHKLMCERIGVKYCGL